MVSRGVMHYPRTSKGCRPIRLEQTRQLAIDRAKHTARGAVRRILRRPPPAEPRYDVADLDRVRELMREYWTSLGHVSSTMRSFEQDAFRTADYEHVLARTHEAWSSLEGKRVLDLGCGWGGLSLLLAHHGADVVFVDRVPQHVEASRLRVPSGKGLVCDGRDLTPIDDELGEFDYVFLHSVIEHVGNAPDHRGPADLFMPEKRRVLHEAARHVRPGGGLFLSTGNYNFPLDGEVNMWFFHWLPKAVQGAVLDDLGIGADNYGLLTWTQLSGLIGDEGLQVERVFPCDTSRIEALLEVFAATLGFVNRGWHLPEAAVRGLIDLMRNDPHYMPTWFAFLRRPAASAST